MPRPRRRVNRPARYEDRQDATADETGATTGKRRRVATTTTVPPMTTATTTNVNTRNLTSHAVFSEAAPVVSSVVPPVLIPLVTGPSISGGQGEYSSHVRSNQHTDGLGEVNVSGRPTNVTSMSSHTEIDFCLFWYERL